MKNNEYNIVNITNEKSNFSAEYTNAQKAEYSFQSENKNPIKDELNDNSTVNDKVEDNLSKATKEKEKKKEKQESEALESSATSSGASSTASSVARSTAAASSAGATGSALGGIVAAATVSVAAIGTIVGINVIGAKEPEPVTFLSSEVTSNSIDYSFSMPSQLLRYEEVSGDTQLGEKMVVATISDGLDFKEEEYLVEYEEYDENVLIFFHSFSGLTPDTAYALTLTLREENPTTEVPNDQQLAYRTFRTDAVGQALKFDTIEATTNSVNFSFIVTNEAVEYDPSLAREPAIQATISDGDSFYDEMWIEQISTYDDSNLMGSGNFTGLSANTKYTITLYVSLEQELRALGSTSFTTQARPSSGFRWGIFTLDTDETVLFRFYVKSSYIGFVEGGPTPNCYAVVSKDGQEVKRSSDISYSTYEYSTDACAAEGTINGLQGSTTYELTIYFVDGQSEEALGDPKEFTTKESSPTFYFEDPDTYFVITDNSICPVFSIKANEVEQSAASGLTNIFMEISDGVNYSDSYNVPYSEFSPGIDTSYLVYSRNHAFEGLSSGTTYTISVRNGSTDETYGSVEVTTTGTYTGFSWGTIETTPSTASISFNISSTYLDYETDPTAAVSSLYIDVNIGTQTVASAGMDSLTPGTGDNLVGKATASGLTSNTTYTLTLYRIVGNDSVAIGQPKTIETDEVAFNGATIPAEVSFNSHQFNITLDFVDDPSNPQYDNLSIQFYDEPYDSENKSTIGSPISLESVTTEQTITIPYSEDGGEIYYDFEFNDIRSYEILATRREEQEEIQVEIYHDDFRFEDTDPEGVITGLNSDYLIAVDSTSEFTLPVQLLYTDEYDKFRSFYVKLFPTDGVTSEVTAGASKEEDYQNLTFSDASSVITYIQNAGADGAEFDVKIYNYDDQSNPLWPKEGQTVEPVYIKVADANIVYGGKLYNTDLSQDSTSVQFGISYVAPVSTPTNPQIQFVDSSDPSLTYSYDFNFENYPTIDMTSPIASTGSAINDYASLKAAFEGKTFIVIIKYYNGTEYKSEQIQTGVSFTFA